MAVHDRVQVWPLRVDLAVNEALEIRLPRIVVLRGRREVERHDVVVRDELRRKRTRQQVAVRLLGMARAYVAEAVENAEAGEDAVGRDEVLDECGEGGHGQRTERFES